MTRSKVTIHDSIESLFENSTPDIAHIVTPPSTHYRLAKTCLENNVHVLIEKPFTENLQQAEELIELARQKGLVIYAGHQLLFQKPVRTARRLTKLIGEIVHLESYFSFRKVRKSLSPVDQIIDILPHPVYTLADFMGRDNPPEKQGHPNIDHVTVNADGEVRALLSQGNIHANLIVTLKGRPVDSYLKIVGTHGMIIIDFVRESVLKHIGPGQDAVAAVLYPYSNAWQSATQSTKTFFGMAMGKNRSYPGLLELITSFYEDVRYGQSRALSPESILSTVSVCQTIGDKLKEEERLLENNAKKELIERSKSLPSLDRNAQTVLVTGGTGFLGSAIVRELRQAGYPVRVISRSEPRQVDRFPGVEYRSTDLAGHVDENLFEGIGCVVHCAAETAGGTNEHRRNSIDATRNIFLGAVEQGITKFIHISSIAVLKSNFRTRLEGLREGSEIDADNVGRGPYVWGKAQSEVMLEELSRQKGVEAKILRPGPLVDYSHFEPPGRLGRSVGSWFVVLSGKKSKLSVCDVNEAAKIVLHYVRNYQTLPRVLNLTSPITPTRLELINRLKESRPGVKSIYIPGILVSLISGTLVLVQKVLSPTKKAINIKAAFSSEKYDTTLIQEIAADAGIEYGV